MIKLRWHQKHPQSPPELQYREHLLSRHGQTMCTWTAWRPAPTVMGDFEEDKPEQQEAT